jgi:hypothetical protein
MYLTINSQMASLIATVLLCSLFALRFTYAASDSILEQIAQLALSAAGVGGVYDNITTDPGVLARFGEAQLYHASLNDSFPTNILLNPNFNSPDRFVAKLCERKDVGKCLYRGTGLTNRPSPAGRRHKPFLTISGMSARRRAER